MTSRQPGQTPPRYQALPRYESVLAVVAHPDDETFGLGAILDAFHAAGSRTEVLCFTRGERSSLGAEALSLGEMRARELAAAAEELGVTGARALDYPDGELGTQPLTELTDAVAAAVHRVGADLLVVFDEGGITGHPDHMAATNAALTLEPPLPVLAWALPVEVADALNAELGTDFVGRQPDELDVIIEVDRGAQHRAIAHHRSQSSGNDVLVRRLELQGHLESLRYLRRATTVGRE